MSWFGFGFSASKLKPQLKMAVNRINIASNKKSAISKQNMCQVAMLLKEDPPKEEKARIRAEALIRDDDIIEAYEIIQLECELLAERIKLIENSQSCPPDMLSCVSTLIYASNRVDIPELQEIRKQLRAKYGKKFEENAMRNAGSIINERVVSKLSVHPPAAFLVQTYLEKICEQYEVDWKPAIKLSVEQMIQPTAAPVGYSVQVGQGTGLGNNIISGGSIYSGQNNEQDIPIVLSATSTTNNNDNEIVVPPIAPGQQQQVSSDIQQRQTPHPIVQAIPEYPKNQDNESVVNAQKVIPSSVASIPPPTEAEVYIPPQAPTADLKYDDVSALSAPPTPKISSIPPVAPFAPPNDIPSAPSAPTVLMDDNTNGINKDDKNDNDDKPSAGPSNGLTYQELEARFNAL